MKKMAVAWVDKEWFLFQRTHDFGTCKVILGTIYSEVQKKILWPEAQPTNQVLVLHSDPGAPLELKGCLMLWECVSLSLNYGNKRREVWLSWRQVDVIPIHATKRDGQDIVCHSYSCIKKGEAILFKKESTNDFSIFPLYIHGLLVKDLLVLDSLRVCQGSHCGWLWSHCTCTRQHHTCSDTTPTGKVF